MRLHDPNSRIQFSPNSSGFKLLVALGAILAAYEAGQIILGGDLKQFAYLGILLVGVVGFWGIFKDWRKGLYVFLVWILLEDLVRKYLGNNMLLYFTKDVLILMVYIVFFTRRTRASPRQFKPPFWIPFVIFLWWGIFEVFNPASTSLSFGLLGMKIYFFYFPLVLLGYSLIESEEDLRRLFLLNAILTLIVAGLGIAQSILGPTFLNPAEQDPYITLLSNTFRISSEGLAAYRPNSVFVSNGRFQDFLLAAWPISVGFAAYLFLGHMRGRFVAVAASITVAVASLMAASRGVFLYNILSAGVILLGNLWGAPRRKQQLRRAGKAILTLAILGTICLAVFVWFFPKEVQSRLDVYSETILPSSPTSELYVRAGDYPQENFMRAYHDPKWLLGYGIGTSSLGVQYLTRVFNVARARIGVESGYGQLILEIGFVGLLLWIGLSISIAWTSWQIVRLLKGTRWFPLGFSIFWYAFLLIIPMAYYTFQAYQDFVINAYLWLFLGILFKLKELSRLTVTGPKISLKEEISPIEIKEQIAPA
jgi:hypothetical protein